MEYQKNTMKKETVTVEIPNEYFCENCPIEEEVVNGAIELFLMKKLV